MSAEEELKEVWELRNRLLELGKPIFIPASEQEQPKGGADPPARDITIVPIYV